MVYLYFFFFFLIFFHFDFVILLLLQLSFFLLIALKLEPYTEVIYGSSLVVVVVFLIYLVNCKGKNEFKIVWMLPVLILPVFGIAFYLFFKNNLGGLRAKRNLKKIKKETEPYFSNLKEETLALKEFPKVRDISTFLTASEKYPPYVNTQTKYYSSGEACFPDMLEALKTAEKFIFIEFFIVEPGEMFSDLIEILAEKAKEGVEVKILYDGLGSLSISSRWNKKYLMDLGIESETFKPFFPLWDTAQNGRDHRKNFIIDGKICFTGGINITDEYINLHHTRFDYWKDSMIRVQGPAVRSFSSMFLQLWYLQKNQGESNRFFKKYLEIENTQMETDGVVIPYGDDAYNDLDIAENVYEYIIDKAHTYVHIMSPYLVVDNTFIENMIFAAKRGVEISIIVPKLYDHLMTWCVGRKHIKTLIENGIKVYQYLPGFIHSKVFVSDDNRATVGSINLDYRSFYHHFEDGVFLYKSSTIQEIERDFQITKAASQEITMEVYKKTPWRFRAIGWLLKIISPLL